MPPNSPQSIAVGGLANADPQPISAPEITVTGTLTQSVKAGQTATYNLTAMPNFTGNLTFTCAGAPTGAMCVPPSTLKVAAGGSASFSVSIATAGATSAVPFRLPRVPNYPILPIQTLAPFFALVLVFLLGGLIRRRPGSIDSRSGPLGRPLLQPMRMIPVAALAPVLAVTLFSVTGCGGGSANAQSAPSVQPTITPQGTFTITLTPTAAPTTGATNQVPPIFLTLTVQ